MFFPQMSVSPRVQVDNLDLLDLQDFVAIKDPKWVTPTVMGCYRLSDTFLTANTNSEYCFNWDTLLSLSIKAMLPASVLVLAVCLD